MPSSGDGGETLLCACGTRLSPLSDAWKWIATGKRNGNYRHGPRTKGATNNEVRQLAIALST